MKYLNIIIIVSTLLWAFSMVMAEEPLIWTVWLVAGTVVFSRLELLVRR